jgi:hypothetical protein
MYEYNFEKLEVWELSVELTVKIYELTRKFPSEENLALPTNLEGLQIQFLQISPKALQD